jgi:rod shape-determining protein MreD
LLFWTEHIFGVVTVDYNMFWSCLSTLLLWPIMCGILNMLYFIVEPNRAV